MEFSRHLFLETQFNWPKTLETILTEKLNYENL